MPARSVQPVAALACAALALCGASWTGAAAPPPAGVAPAPAQATSQALATARARDPHAGMVHVRGGDFWMGSDDPAFPDAQPVHRV
ncbi:MAG: hypothetical protein U1E73_14475, partial [Planctomycetota bacterium]